MSKTRIVLASSALALLAAIAGYGLARLQWPNELSATQTARVERPVLYWYDPMVPTQHFNAPGKSPFMDMQLVPKYADEPDTAASVGIDPATAQNLGMRLAIVRSGNIAASIDATGIIAFNDRDSAIVQARSGGFVERSYRLAAGDVIETGTPIADIYVPEWAGAQTEFLALLRTGEAALIEAGRQRLRLLGIPPELIAEVERSATARPVITIAAPIAGVLTSLNVRPGMAVAAGMTLAEVNGLATVWLNISVPEAQGGAVRIDQMAAATLTAYPGETFSGRVAAILPEAEAESRTLKIRVELPNVSRRLRPGMFAMVRLTIETEAATLLVPAEAVIRTGRRTIVMVAVENGRYRPAEVQIGREADGRIEIHRGLREGERVVASGQFLIDSEASLTGMNVRPLEDSAP